MTIHPKLHLKNPQSAWSFDSLSWGKQAAVLTSPESALHLTPLQMSNYDCSQLHTWMWSGFRLLQKDA